MHLERESERDEQVHRFVFRAGFHFAMPALPSLVLGVDYSTYSTDVAIYLHYRNASNTLMEAVQFAHLPQTHLISPSGNEGVRCRGYRDSIVCMHTGR